MTERSFPFESGPGAIVSETDWHLMTQWFMRAGVYKDYLGGLLVTGGQAGRNVAVSTGAGWAYGLFYLNDATVLLPVEPNNGGGARTDVVVVRFDWQEDRAYLWVVTGTPGGGLGPIGATPNLRWDLELARFTVAVGFTSIPAPDVLDRRVDAVPRPHNLLTDHVVANQSTGQVLRTTSPTAYAFGTIGEVAFDSSVQKRNLLLNGGFEHKSREVSEINPTLGSGAQFFHDGWQGKVGTGETLKVQDTPTTLAADSGRAAYCTVTAAATNQCQYFQDFRTVTGGGASGGQHQLRGHAISLTGVVYLAANRVAGAVTLFVQSDTGLTYFSTPHSGSAVPETLAVANALIPNNASYVVAGVIFNNCTAMVAYLDNLMLTFGPTPTYYYGIAEAEDALNCRARYQRIPSSGSMSFTGYNAASWPDTRPLALVAPMAQIPSVSVPTAFSPANLASCVVTPLGRDHIQLTATRDAVSPPAAAWAAYNGVVVCESNPV